ncbi:MAG: DUF4062 domain-containing protein [Pseudomonadota bacterium]
MLSSTVEDLGDIRQRAHRVCRELNLEIISMEGNVAVADSVRGFSIDLVENADVYVGIVAQNAGSKPAGDELHYTHLEYQRALFVRLPRLLFLSKVDDEMALDRQVADLRNNMLQDEDAVAAIFDDSDDFDTRLRDSLVGFIESWRKARGFNPEQAELDVDPATVEQGEAIDVVVSGPAGTLRNTIVRFQKQEIELDEEGCGSAKAAETGSHNVELILKTDDAESALRKCPVTVTYPSGHLTDLATAGAFLALFVWVLLGFLHPRALDPAPDAVEVLHFKNDYLGHILIGGAVIVAFSLGVVWKRVRKSLGAVILPIDQQWRALRWWITPVVMIVMAIGAYLNVDIIVTNAETWWWSQDARNWTLWSVSAAYFLVALVPILLLIVRLILALNGAARRPREVPTYDPASPDGHFGLAWLGNTVFGFLAVGSVPLNLAASWFIVTNEQVGLSTPFAVMIAIAIIGMLGAIPLREAYARLEEQRLRSLSLEKKRRDKLLGIWEAVLTEREREDRSKEIDTREKRIQAIEAASSVVMSRFGVVCMIVLVTNVTAPVVLLFM